MKWPARCISAVYHLSSFSSTSCVIVLLSVSLYCQFVTLGLCSVHFVFHFEYKIPFWIWWFTPNRVLHASTYTPEADRKRMRADNGGLSFGLFSSVYSIYFLVDELRIIAICYLCCSHLITVWIHGSQNVDAGGVDEGLNSLVPQDVLWTQVLGHVDEQLSAQHFIAMHVAQQLDLWLHYSWKRVLTTVSVHQNVPLRCFFFFFLPK